MVEAHGYPYQEHKFGIPFKDLPLGFLGVIKGGSGRILRCHIEKDEISVVDVADEDHFRLDAKTVDGTMWMLLLTDRSGERHPDLFAGKFFEFALRYFEINGYTVSKFQARWQRWRSGHASNNYDQFIKNTTLGVNPATAAKNTWTGKILERLGFTEVESLEVKEDELGVEKVLVLFSKPDL